MRILLFLLFGVLFSSVSRAELVEQTIRPGVIATADYVAGDRAKPAILLVHGFLQTREFPTVVALAHSLQDAGYTTLAPTLSLGIPHRKQSLPCEAVHRHTMENDVDEIARWVKWLKARGNKSIVMFGHSFGSLQLLAYLQDTRDPAIKAYIGASLIEAQTGKLARAPLVADLESRVRSGQHALVNHSLSFCGKYVSTPAGMLSYARWGQPQTLAALKKAPVKKLLIMGDADSMLAPGWLTALGHVEVPIAVVKGANHFMDGMHEFDLVEQTIAFLDTLKAPPR